MPALPEFRENAARALYVTGTIDEALVHRLLPSISRLRGEGSQPITAYVDSRGGSTYFAEQLRESIVAPNQKGETCWLVTVTYNRAASAAADFLALGNYAIAYPHAAFHCHGSRMPADDITTEKAQSLAASLRTSNESFALRLARRGFARMAFHFANLRQDFGAIRRAAKKTDNSVAPKNDLECFAFAIHLRLASRELKLLPYQAFQLHRRLEEMKDFVFNNISWPNDESFAEKEAVILRKLIEFEMGRHKEENDWTFSDGGTADIVSDFDSLKDYLAGPHREEMIDKIQTFGPLFLKPSQLSDYSERRQQDEKKAAKWLRKRTERFIEPLWFFTVSLCRLLQSGEYSLTASDAYWLGLIDEVVGERLPCLRLIAEDANLVGQP